jgi:hypothetical protein
VDIRRSKPDQEGKAASIGLMYGSDPATCPVRTRRAWLDAASVDEGPIFRHVDRHGRLLAARISGRAAAERMKRYCTAAGLDAAPYGGHSLRAGAHHVGHGARGAGAPNDAAQRPQVGYMGSTPTCGTRTCSTVPARSRWWGSDGRLHRVIVRPTPLLRHWHRPAARHIRHTGRRVPGRLLLAVPKQPPTLSWRDAVRLVLDHPADDS